MNSNTHGQQTKLLYSIKLLQIETNTKEGVYMKCKAMWQSWVTVYVLWTPPDFVPQSASVKASGWWPCISGHWIQKRTATGVYSQTTHAPFRCTLAHSIQSASRPYAINKITYILKGKSQKPDTRSAKGMPWLTLLEAFPITSDGWTS